MQSQVQEKKIDPRTVEIEIKIFGAPPGRGTLPPEVLEKPSQTFSTLETPGKWIGYEAEQNEGKKTRHLNASRGSRSLFFGSRRRHLGGRAV
ncbi:hypothetical protein EVAR_75691_1 [Eumeta japonica]|uniref:Uncharacterized protein n=1 Tax=Eumeta variegata TaxID=151549 RepID=A0A4C1W191_EUMVA|nr:hypothetical protein EVAR_75691_1 [Eumeta japonica]